MWVFTSASSIVPPSVVVTWPVDIYPLWPGQIKKSELEKCEYCGVQYEGSEKVCTRCGGPR